ncbi:MAG: cysteine--tRNA ligase [Acidobacteria bacterium]|nr:cysteine--tRNA ligase [Acidobacteriota bacterium]MBV9477017.1 cysteine--tRNA ligase [Acidobacteriota bacterium]
MSDLKLFNTLTREKEPFVPLQPGEVRMYSCGPTVYNHPHIGNLRTFLWSDLLRRYLEYRGLRVTQVMNITDVEDKIIRNANAAGQDIRTYTAPYVDAFHDSLAKLRIRKADHYPRATEYVTEMVALVQQLTSRGHTYEADGSTYFRVATLPDYGKLSRVEIDTSSEYSRIEADEYEKESARDFVLWKAKKDNEPSWQTPLGEGRPGWHLECSAMAMDLLGETFDIHTGAVDLIFPHHENEIAQSEGTTGKPFVRYWVHGEHLNIDAQKMSKSLGNIYTIREIEEMGYDALALRYALLSVPHRTKLNFTTQSLDDAKAALARIESFLLRLDDVAKSAPHDAAHADEGGDALIGKFLGEFQEAMDDDLNTAGALGALFTFIRDANSAIDAGRISASDAAGIQAALMKVDPVLDLFPARERNLDAEIEALIAARNAARKARNFAESDRLRNELDARGILLEDTPAGTRWRRK